LYLLDTNHCSRIIFGDTTILPHVTEVGESQLATSIIVAGELIFMAQNSEQRATNVARVDFFLQDINLYFIDEETANIYGEFKAEIIARFGPRERSRRRRTRIEELGIHDNDLWIAATALRHNLVVVSSDSDFERMRQVRTFPWENWLL
jgi:tRNA(fMet)-specific endonuclease VapC